MTSTSAALGWARLILQTGALSAGWGQALTATPRHLFLPDLMWPLDPTTGRYLTLDRARDPQGWRRWADADVPIVTQWDDGRHTGTAPGTMATSSASQPSLVAGMLADLDVEPGHRVLDVGAGTGWTTALLAAHAGAERVVGVELDPAVAELAQARLSATVTGGRVVTGDGAPGWAHDAPYDRVQCTYAVLGIPEAWVAQTRPGGVIVAPWRNRYTHHGAVARLTVHGDGTASGHFTRPAEFMQSRPERQPDWIDHADYVPPGDAWPPGTVETSTSLDGEMWEPFSAAAFIVGALVPDIVHTIDRDGETLIMWLYSLRDRSWAAAFYDGDPVSEVYQGGGHRRLWDEVETACRWWTGQGRPDCARFGLTAGPQGQTLWLDQPDHQLPVITRRS